MSATMDVIQSVKEYYGKTLQTNKDLKTNACTTTCQKIQPQFLEAIRKINEIIIEKYYGCGLCIPDCLAGCHVLDLGCGAGRDCYILSQLVGENGKVIGLDMTEEQIQVAKQFELEHANKFGYSRPNTEFLLGYIEAPIKAGVKENSMDLVVSNCVVNLSPNKKAVLLEAYKTLKVGGELYFSDVYCDRELSEDVKKHEVLWGECISGALYWQELHRLAAQIGFSQPRLMSASEITVSDEFKDILGDSKFVSVTYRLFKLPDNVAPNKDVKTQVIYEGGIPYSEDCFKFDCHNVLKKGEISCVDEELALIFTHSRFGKYFSIKPAESRSSRDKDQSSCDLDFSKILNPFDWLNSKVSSASSCQVSKSGKCC